MAKKIDGAIIKKCCQIMRDSGIILYPTDTVWGIGCDATNPDAVAKIYALKKRVDSKALIVLVDSVEMARGFVEVLPCSAQEIFDTSGDGAGAITLVLPGVVGLAPNLVAQDGSVGFRVPDNRFCQMMLTTMRTAVVSTSANVSGGATPTAFAKIAQEIIDGVDYVVPVEYEAESSGKPSSIIKLSVDGALTIIR